MPIIVSKETNFDIVLSEYNAGFVIETMLDFDKVISGKQRLTVSDDCKKSLLWESVVSDLFVKIEKI